MANVIVNGVIIGIIAVVIFSAVLYTITFQGVNMSGDALSPTIKNGDLVYYETFPITEIKTNHLVVSKHYSNDRGYFFKIGIVTGIGKTAITNDVMIRTKNLVGDTDTLFERHYIGKVSNVIPNAGYIINDLLKPPKGIWVFIIIFISPIIIMKIRERNQTNKNS